MKLYKVTDGMIINHENRFYSLQGDWDNLINRGRLHDHLKTLVAETNELSAKEADTLLRDNIMPPVGQQEIWAAGVTYLRSRDARMDESQKSGGASLYDRVYDAERPELFFKSLPHRVAGHDSSVYIRRDSSWNVPEPELTLFINSDGQIQGYTIGNDMSSRSIEGDNALYLPQAKIYERSAALGPGLYIPEEPISTGSVIRMMIIRDGKTIYDDSVSISKMKRNLIDLASYLYRECEFHHGCYLMTGTCLVPPDGFTLQEEDIVEISIDAIGTLTNKVTYNPSKSY